MTVALIPPFNLETAREKVQRAEDLWNTRDASINEEPIDASQRTLF